MCIHALAHVQTCVSVGAAPTGTGRARRGWPICSQASHTDGAIYKTPVPHTPAPARASDFQAPFPKLVGRRRPGRAPRLLCGSPVGRGQGVHGRGGVDPSLGSVPGWAPEGSCLSPLGLRTACACSLECPSRLVLLANTCSARGLSVTIPHPCEVRAPKSRSAPQPILCPVPTRGGKSVLDKYSVHRADEQMCDGDTMSWNEDP